MSCFALSKHKINDGFKYLSHPPPQQPAVTKRSIFQAFSGRSSCPSSPSMTRNAENQTITALKEEIWDLTSKLTHVIQERDYLEQNLNRIQLEKLRLAREKDDQLDSQSSRYEERLTELHSVIAELSRQLEKKNRDQIVEEEGEEIDDDEEEEEVEEEVNEEDIFFSKRDSESGSTKTCPKGDLGSRTSTDIDAAAFEAGRRLVAHLEKGEGEEQEEEENERIDKNFFCFNDSTTSLQLMALQQELSDARQRNVQLTMRLREREVDLEDVRGQLEAVTREKENMRSALSELQRSNRKISSSESAKMAQRKKIKKMEVRKRVEINDSDDDDDDVENDNKPYFKKPVTGSDLVKVRNNVVAEHLVQDIQDKSSMVEFSNYLFSRHQGEAENCNLSPSHSTPLDRLQGDEDIRQSRRRRMTDGLEGKMKEFEIEMNRLSSKIDHLKSQNEVLNLTLHESKSQCDHLTILIGKYESNNTAQQLVIGNAEQIIENYEVLLALLETEMGVLLAACKNTSGLEDLVSRNGDEKLTDSELLQRASENRMSAENLAQRLLNRLDLASRPDSGLAGHAYASSCDDSSRTSSSSSSNESDSALGSRSEENRIRDYISELKGKMVLVRSTLITELESLYPLEVSENRSKLQSRTCDLEMAVLVQELMALREERADLRARVYLLEREKSSMELVINSQQNQEDVLTMQVRHLESELHRCENSRLEEGSENTDIFQQNGEFKSRIAELLQTLEKVKRNSELRQQQSDELVSDLKRANSSLSEALEVTKRKYRSKMKRMEQQILQAMLHSQLPVRSIDEDPNRSIISMTSETTDDQSEY